jgi:transposase-like protein
MISTCKDPDFRVGTLLGATIKLLCRHLGQERATLKRRATDHRRSESPSMENASGTRSSSPIAKLVAQLLKLRR